MGRDNHREGDRCPKSSETRPDAKAFDRRMAGQCRMFDGMSLERIEELARAAELEELVEQKRALDRENEGRRNRGEKLLVLCIERREEQG